MQNSNLNHQYVSATGDFQPVVSLPPDEPSVLPMPLRFATTGYGIVGACRICGAPMYGKAWITEEEFVAGTTIGPLVRVAKSCICAQRPAWGIK